MREITKNDIDWVCNASFGRHKSPDTFIKSLTLKEIAGILLMVWEAGNIDSKPKGKIGVN